MELKECADSLDIQLYKIGQVLDNRRVASSFRTVQTVWRNYPALNKYFTQAAEDATSQPMSYNGLAKLLSSYAFINNLGLLYDALQGLL